MSVVTLVITAGVHLVVVAVLAGRVLARLDGITDRVTRIESNFDRLFIIPKK